MAINPCAREYRIWKNMRTRCMNPKNPNYPYYGGRGITICTRWDTFANFLADMGKAPTGLHTIDRIDNGGNYCPENCRWASRKEQSRNTRTNRFVTWNGESLCVAEWAERLGITHTAMKKRLNTMPVEKAMLPVRMSTANIVEFNGEQRRLTDLAAEHGISVRTIRSRLRIGIPLAEAFFVPRKTGRHDQQRAAGA